MSKDKKIDIIKGAILLEHKGKALYESVTKTATVEGVRTIFDMLVKEEEKHIQILTEQYSNLLRGQEIDSSDLEKEDGTVTAAVLSDDVVKDIFGAGYEAAVISAALELEKKAVAYYSESAEKADSEGEENLYRWLAKWEKTHMMMLSRIDSEIRERIWYDNQFWPLD